MKGWSALQPSLHFFFFNDTATTEIYTLSLHDALPIFRPQALRGHRPRHRHVSDDHRGGGAAPDHRSPDPARRGPDAGARSEEHTSELQSRQYLVCRLLLEKKNEVALADLCTIAALNAE